MFPCPLKSLITVNLVSVPAELPILDFSCEWNHTICDLLCLDLFTDKVYPYSSTYQHFISFYSWTFHFMDISYFWSCVHHLMDMCVIWVFFFFLLYTIIMTLRTSSVTCFSSIGHKPRSELLGHMIKPMLNPLRNGHFPRGCTTSHSYQQHTNVPVSHPHRHLLRLLSKAFLIGKKCTSLWF